MNISYSKKLVIGIAAINVVLLAAFFYWFVFQKTSAEEMNLRCNTRILESSLIGRTLPEYEFLSRNGNNEYANLIQGKVLIVVFLTHCQACLTEFDFLQNHYDEIGSEFKIVAITSETEKIVEKFNNVRQLGFPIYLDVQGSLMLKTRVACTPTLLFVENGIVRKVKIGNTTDYKEITEGF